METENTRLVRKGLEITEKCLGNCERVHLNIDIFRPSKEVMDMVLTEDFKFEFNSDRPDDDIFIFHVSRDKYANNGAFRFAFFLSQVPEVLKHVRKNKRVQALIRELKKKGGENIEDKSTV